MSLSLCTHGYLEQGNCSVGDTAFLGSSAASKGGTVQISGDKGSSVVEFAGCLVVNSSAGMGFDDDPQGDGGAFSVGTGVTLILANSTVWGGTAGNKVSLASSGVPMSSEALFCAERRGQGDPVPRASLSDSHVEGW